MKKKEDVGTKKVPNMQQFLDSNQQQMVDQLITPHERMPESNGARFAVAANYPAAPMHTQPTQANGSVVPNGAIAPMLGTQWPTFQAPGPRFLAPTPTRPGMGSNPMG